MKKRIMLLACLIAAPILTTLNSVNTVEKTEKIQLKKLPETIKKLVSKEETKITPGLFWGKTKEIIVIPGEIAKQINHSPATIEQKNINKCLKIYDQELQLDLKILNNKPLKIQIQDLDKIKVFSKENITNFENIKTIAENSTNNFENCLKVVDGQNLLNTSNHLNLTIKIKNPSGLLAANSFVNRVRNSDAYMQHPVLAVGTLSAGTLIIAYVVVYIVYKSVVAIVRPIYNCVKK